MRDLPPVPEELVQALEQAFPSSLPKDHFMDPRELAFRVGQQNIIGWLRQRMEAQHRKANI